MKKIISLILSAVFLLSGYVSFQKHGEAAQNQIYDKLDLLQFLEIIPSEYDKISLNPEQRVTRADFAVYFTKLLNRVAYSRTELYYNDMPRTHYAYNEVTLLTEEGYFQGYGGAQFRPDEFIKSEHAYSLILKAMGYGYYIELKGLKAAAAYAEVLDGITPNDELTFGNMITFMYNALMAKCIEVGINVNVSYKKGDSTFLYYTRKMNYVRRGLVNGADGVDIYGNNLEDGSIAVDGYEYSTKLDNVFEYIGYEVEYIYRESEDDKHEIVWIKTLDNSKNGEVIDIYVDENCEFSRDKYILEYTDSAGKQKREYLAKNITVIYNGTFLNSGVEDVLGRNKYELRLFSVDGGKNNLAIVYSYDNIVVSGKNTQEYLVYDKLTKKAYNFDTNEYDRAEITLSTGENITFEDIKDGDVISLYISENAQRLRAVVSREKVSGSVQARDDDGHIKIGDIEYQFYDWNMADNIGAAKALTLYLDYKGYVAFSESKFVAANQFVGYAYHAWVDEDSENICFKILNENGNLEIVQAAEKFRMEGHKVSDAISAVDSLGKSDDLKFKPQLLLFTKNSEGFITNVNKASDNGGTTNTLIKNKTLQTKSVWHAEARSGQNKIGLEMLYDSSTKVFHVPEDDRIRDAQPVEFSVESVKNMGKYPGAVSYKTTRDEVFFEQYIIYKSKITTDFSPTEGLFMVDKVRIGLDEDDDIVPIIEGLQDGGAKKYTFDLNYVDYHDGDLKKGDLIRIAHQDTKITRYELIYRHDVTGTVAVDRGYGEAEYRLFSGFAHSRSGNAVKIGYESPLDDDEIINLISGGDKIMVYDSSGRGEVYKGTADDIKAYQTVGEGASKIVVHTNRNTNYAIAVYN